MSSTGTLLPEAVAHLRHELRTPINHILGYTEILIEDAPESGLAELIPEFQRIHSGGRKLLESIHAALADEGEPPAEAQLFALEAALTRETSALLAGCEGLRGKILESGAEPALADLAPVTKALERLRSLVAEMTGAGVAAPRAHDAVPVEAGHSETESGADAKESGAQDTNNVAHLLIVEDNPVNRNLLRRRLEREGYRVSEAANGALALDRLSSSAFDLMLLDVMMPEMDGFEVLARVKRDEVLRELPVIMISALDEIQSVVRCIEMGAEDYLPKPFDPVLLRARIGASLEKKRLRDREHEKTAELERALQQLKETQDQLVVQEKMASLGALTAGIAHEIKNPLNFVTNFAEVSLELLEELRETLPAGEAAELAGDLRKNLEKIREHGKRADSIVRGMLAHSRGGSGQREPVDLNALVAEAVNLAYHGLRALDANFNIALESCYDPSLPKISATPQSLSRVFLNLANNGCYAAHQKKLQLGESFQPTLHVATRKLPDALEVRVRDNGSGIPPDVLPKIFHPFFTTKPTGSGTGLGLSLSYQIVVDQHKGAIRAESQPGEFTEFVVTLPI